MAGLSWSERDARKERDRKASERLQAEIERDWQAKLAAKENRRPVTFDDAEKASQGEALERASRAPPADEGISATRAPQRSSRKLPEGPGQARAGRAHAPGTVSRGRGRSSCGI